MMISATKSSTTATVRMKMRSPPGSRLPSSASMPRAKAVSVDIAAPQPWAVLCPALMAR